MQPHAAGAAAPGLGLDESDGPPSAAETPDLTAHETERSRVDAGRAGVLPKPSRPPRCLELCSCGAVHTKSLGPPAPAEKPTRCATADDRNHPAQEVTSIDEAGCPLSADAAALQLTAPDHLMNTLSDNEGLGTEIPSRSKLACFGWSPWGAVPATMPRKGRRCVGRRRRCACRVLASATPRPTSCTSVRPRLSDDGEQPPGTDRLARIRTCHERLARRQVSLLAEATGAEPTRPPPRG